jgi:hypothetical protein
MAESGQEAADSGARKPLTSFMNPRLEPTSQTDHQKDNNRLIIRSLVAGFHIFIRKTGNMARYGDSTFGNDLICFSRTLKVTAYAHNKS